MNVLQSQARKFAETTKSTHNSFVVTGKCTRSQVPPRLRLEFSLEFRCGRTLYQNLDLACVYWIKSISPIRSSTFLEVLIPRGWNFALPNDVFTT